MEPVRMTPNGIICEQDGAQVALDPASAVPGAASFVSHAHADHLPAGSGPVICSAETRAIAALRGTDLGPDADPGPARMVDAGHILGSRGLVFGDVFYTGDICTRDRGFLRGARPPRCRVLVTESTFGAPGFSFPPVREVRDRANQIISEMYARGVPVVLMGHGLGKAQTLTDLFGHWDPLYLHDGVHAMNELHRSLGVDLPAGIPYSEASRRGLLARRPWVMVCPMLPSKSPLVRELRSVYGAVTIAFTGWAASPGRPDTPPVGRGADHVLPLSDHCDRDELLDLARRTGAEEAYVTHGFEEDLAAALADMGVRARPLGAARGRQTARTRTRRRGRSPSS